MRTDISNTDDIIDSRDVIARIATVFKPEYVALIAAAPELLAATRELLIIATNAQGRWPISSYKNNPMRDDEIKQIALAKAAIAKAEGAQ